LETKPPQFVPIHARSLHKICVHQTGRLLQGLLLLEQQ
jgi:hypothetical protein